MTTLPRSLAVSSLALALAACGGTGQPEARYIAEGNPPLLSDWGQVGLSGGDLVLGGNVVAYDMNTALFTDYAHKLRTIWMPDGTTAHYREGDTLDFPVGTVITKTFYYPRIDGELGERVARTEDTSADFQDGRMAMDQVRLVETRILVHRENGWVALPYRWNEDQTEARLHRVGAVIPMTLVAEDGGEEAFNYVMPNTNQCAGCHAPDSNSRAISPIGPKPRHINRDFAYTNIPQNQLERLETVGFLEGLPDLAQVPRNAAWGDEHASLDELARSYLDVNCSHCHSEVGPADTSGLFLEPDTPFGPNLGVCKLPIAAGSGTGNRPYDIVPGEPENSILVYRIDNVEPDEMMPELGRSTVHAEGLELVERWITEMTGSCEI
ncbi:SO2930 family diheme c-type cytochrome [Maricaulis sp.]|uniref:SO2930 family diheme c-type cytochrome n=1 Tax=Maricaulis sp. TaxID=1486257 RepID=UPI001B024B2C|nr:SO2930 family diheme c-type cytochrome [Maricaulis sp.]MBO6795885.1 hypothetical protein [Maricaulis sp.]